MDDLDRIPWKNLTHAYGPASDIPELLRALRTVSPNLRGEESPLWQLFGNIWHQGTVYEATSYAVPSLIGVAVDRRTPDRVGVLSLLAAIANGSSDEPTWAQQAHEAVAAGFAAFIEMTTEPGDVRFATAHVLANLPEHGAETAAVFRRLLRDEQRIPYRAGLLLLLGSTGDGSQETLSVLNDAMNGDEAACRHAAAHAICRLKFQPLSETACQAIVDAILDEELETSLEVLPWDVATGLNPDELFSHLGESHQAQVIDHLIASLESGNASATAVGNLVNFLFPIAESEPTPKVTAAGMTPRQLRAVGVLYNAMKEGKRIFYGYFPCWGLPDTMREWRELASGREPSPVDESLPLLADAGHPHVALMPGRLKVGQRVIHRHFGPGTVLECNVARPMTAMTIRFDEDGIKELSLPTDGSPLSKHG